MKKKKYQNLIKPLLICLGLLLCLAGCAATVTYLDQGRKLIATEKWDEAVQFFQEALAKYPEDMEVKLLLKEARWLSSQNHMAAGEIQMKSGHYNDALQELQISLAMNPMNRKAAYLIDKTRNQKEAAFHIRQGRTLIKTKQSFKAREAFKKAVSLDPDNREARQLLSYFEKRESRPPRYRLKLDNKDPISLKFKNTPVINVFEILSSLTGVNFIFDKDVRESKVTLFMTDVKFHRFLEVLLNTSNLRAKVVDAKSMIVYPNTPAKLKEYQDLQIRTFYLANLNAKQAVGMLSKVLKSKYIIANEKLNAVIIRAPMDKVEVASRIIAANDRSLAEVLLNVEILEVSRTKEKQLGLEISPASVNIGIGEGTSEVSSDAGFVEQASLKALQSISSREIMLSVPTATLNFLRQDGDTRILATPQIRVRSGNPSKIHIGERIPLRTNRRVDTTGVVTFDYQYYDVGVKLNAKPEINMYGEISLDLKLEISSLGSNVGTADDPQYAIRTRTAQSILTVYNGEAVIVGGLITDEERETIRSVPALGDIPAIGRLFTNENSTNVRTDILMAITPIIIRDQEIPESSVSEVWSGTEDDFSTIEPYESISEKEEKYLNRPRTPIPERLKREKIYIPPLQIR